jgi:hypothetical protein
MSQHVNSLQPVTDAVGTLVNTGGAATLAAILGDPANVALATSIAKIAAANAGGLAATADSLAYGIGEIERHFHSWERWMAVAAVVNGEVKVADRIGTGTAAFRATAGNNTWGAWLQILGSSDTPVIGGLVKFDIHRMSIVATGEVSATYFVQMGFGVSGAQALLDNTFSSFLYRVGSAQTRETPIPVQHRRQAAGTKAWLRIWALTKNGATLDFYFGLHEYEG